MGQEITASRFRKQDFRAFERRLRDETTILERWMNEGKFSSRHGVGGFELEAWLVDAKGCPAPINDRFLALVADPLISPELSRFNIEFNTTPQVLEGRSLRRMHEELDHLWRRADRIAGQLDAGLVMIGILPTVAEEMLTLPNMSEMGRYKALNEQILRARQGSPLVLDIEGADEHLHTVHGDVMLEAATTSFQLHLQVSAEQALRYYNASVILAAPMVAVAANSPLLFGRRLWAETRVPLFEQSVEAGGFEAARFGPVKRVTFGSAYVRNSLFELFRDNLEHYPILLPVDLGLPPERFAHLRLHNGTIWRWNRPLIGFDPDGTPHLRIEHRVMASGPTVVDSIANAALFFGLVQTLANSEEPPETVLPFTGARDNFYAAARFGLKTPITWIDGRHPSLSQLFRTRLLREAEQGLRELGCDPDDILNYLGIIEGRIRSGRTGAWWQLSYLDRHGPDKAQLVAAYRERQQEGRPVHEWSV